MDNGLTKAQQARLEQQKKLQQRKVESELNRLMIAQTQLLNNRRITQVEQSKIRSQVKEQVDEILQGLKANVMAEQQQYK